MYLTATFKLRVQTVGPASRLIARSFIHGDYGLSCRGIDSLQCSIPYISSLNSALKYNFFPCLLPMPSLPSSNKYSSSDKRINEAMCSQF